MKELSRIASAVQASTTMAIDAMFKQMKADGVDVIGFGAGSPTSTPLTTSRQPALRPLSRTSPAIPPQPARWSCVRRCAAA